MYGASLSQSYTGAFIYKDCTRVYNCSIMMRRASRPNAMSGGITMTLKTRALCLLIVIVLAVASMPVCVYADQDAPGSWAVKQIETLKSLDFGFPEMYTDYKKNITREEFAMLVCCLYERITGINAECGDLNAFTDISGSPYRSEILKAGTLRIVNGIGKKKFDPKGEITRQQMAVMLQRTIKALRPGIEPISDPGLVFKDEDKIADWARPSVAYIYDNHIMKGTTELTVEPLSKATREQALVFIFKTGFFTGLLGDNAITGTVGYKISSEDDGIIEDRSYVGAEDYWKAGRKYCQELFMPDRAITAYNKALEVDPNFYKAYRDKAEAYLYKARYDDGLKSVQSALMFYDQDGLCYFCRGRLYYKKGEYDKALEDFNKAVELITADKAGDTEAYDKATVAGLYTSRALCYIKKSMFKDAVQDFKAAAEIDPGAGAVLKLLDINK